jgi:hypothetical protein
VSAPAAQPAYPPVAEPRAQCNRGTKAEVLRFQLHEGGPRCSPYIHGSNRRHRQVIPGVGRLNRGAFPNLRAPERLSFPRFLTAAPLTNGWHPNRLGPRMIIFPPGFIVAATEMLQVSDFHSRRARGLWKSRACSPRTDRVRVNKTQASRCYECPRVTFRCPLTKLRAAGCALFQNESSDVVWSRQTDFSI